MAETFLHGVEVLEIDQGPRPIQTARSAVIGIIGTAPDAEPATPATLTLSPSVAGGAVIITGPANDTGNLYTVRVAKPAAASQSLAVFIDGKAVNILLATDASAKPATTAAQLVAALQANDDFTANLSASLPVGSTGSGLVSAQPVTYLSGGKTEAFPFNTPVLVAGSRKEAARLGNRGTLPAAIDQIFDQTGAVMVVVRVSEGADAAGTLTNILGGVSPQGAMLGLQSFLDAESLVGFPPRILVAPGFTGQMAVVSELIGIAQRLRAVVVADGPDTDDASAIAYAGNFGSDRVYLVDPGLKVLADGTPVIRPASAAVAGVIARKDNEVGFWASPSNTEINGIVGTSRPVDFAMGDPNSRANLLNEKLVGTVIRQNGFRLWGNRTTAADPKYAFLCVRRTADIIQDSILRAHLWAVDKGITKNYLADVTEGVNAYLRDLKAKGAIIDGICWPDPDLNNSANIASGKVYFNFDFTPVYPAERVVFRSIITNKYLSELTA